MVELMQKKILLTMLTYRLYIIYLKKLLYQQGIKQNVVMKNSARLVLSIYFIAL